MLVTQLEHGITESTVAENREHDLLAIANPADYAPDLLRFLFTVYSLPERTSFGVLPVHLLNACVNELTSE
jgi:hypothetical protein